MRVRSRIAEASGWPSPRGHRREPACTAIPPGAASGAGPESVAAATVVVRTRELDASATAHARQPRVAIHRRQPLAGAADGATEAASLDSGVGVAPRAAAAWRCARAAQLAAAAPLPLPSAMAARRRRATAARASRRGGRRTPRSSCCASVGTRRTEASGQVGCQHVGNDAETKRHSPRTPDS